MENLDHQKSLIVKVAQLLNAESCVERDAESGSFEITLNSLVRFLALPGRFRFAGRITWLPIFPGQRSGASVTTSAERSPEHTAKDLTRRFLPAALEYGRKAYAAQQRELEQTSAARALLQQLEAYLGPIQQVPRSDFDLISEGGRLRLREISLKYHTVSDSFTVQLDVSWPCLLQVAKLVSSDEMLARQARAVA